MAGVSRSALALRLLAGISLRSLMFPNEPLSFERVLFRCLYFYVLAPFFLPSRQNGYVIVKTRGFKIQLVACERLRVQSRSCGACLFPL